MFISEINTIIFGTGLERFYPETYNVIYPLVHSACNNFSGPITEENLEKLTNDVYNNIPLNRCSSLFDEELSIENDSDSSESRTTSSEQRSPNGISSSRPPSGGGNNMPGPRPPQGGNNMPGGRPPQGNNPPPGRPRPPEQPGRPPVRPPQRPNRTLRDLIRILIIRELLGRR